jgi:hypothetical protein
MANPYTQIKLHQVTGSFGTSSGQINDATGAAAAGAIDAGLGLSVVLSHMASAIKRLNGAATFSAGVAGAVIGGRSITGDTTDEITLAVKGVGFTDS